MHKCGPASGQIAGSGVKLAQSDTERPSGFPGGRVLGVERMDGRRPALLPRRGLPQFDLVPFRVDDPAELAELGVVGFLQHVASFVAQCLKQRV